MKPSFMHSVVVPIFFAVMALFFLVIGLRGIIFRKPFVISGRWLFVLVLCGFAPSTLQFAQIPRTGGGSEMIELLRWLIPIMLMVVAVFLYFTLRGFTAFGVTDVSFREGLFHSLKGLNLPYEETLSAIKLPTLEADLQVAVQSSIGTGQLKMKQRQFSTELREIVKGMNQVLSEWCRVKGQPNLLCFLRHYRGIHGSASRGFLVRFRPYFEVSAGRSWIGNESMDRCSSLKVPAWTRAHGICTVSSKIPLDYSLLP